MSPDLLGKLLFGSKDKCKKSPANNGRGFVMSMNMKRKKLFATQLFKFHFYFLSVFYFNFHVGSLVRDQVGGDLVFAGD